MIKLLRYQKCFGLKLGSRLELWIALPNYRIPAHTHPEDDSYVYHLFSNATLVRVRQGIEKRIECKPFRCFLKKFLLLGSDTHWFQTNSLPLIFANVAIKKRYKSPANNFKLTIQ